MSTFFRALERAEQERAMRRPTPAPEPASAPPPETHPRETLPAESHPRETPSAQAPRSVFTAPRPAAATEPAHIEPLEDHARELDDHLVSLLAPTSFEAEQYRELRYTIEQARRSTDLSVIAVSSPSAGDGKTTTAINLAGALAQAPDARVLLVDADLRVPKLGAYLGISEHAALGLVDAILNASLPLETVTQALPYLNLSVITAGRRPSAPYEVLKSPRVGQLLAEARRKYNYIVVDTPPLVSVPDGRVFGEWVDGFLVVVAAHRTPRKLFEEVFNVTETSKILGLVFNGDDRHLSRDSYGSYGTYGSSSGRVSRNGLRRSRTASDE